VGRKLAGSFDTSPMLSWVAEAPLTDLTRLTPDLPRGPAQTFIRRTALRSPQRRIDIYNAWIRPAAVGICVTAAMSNTQPYLNSVLDESASLSGTLMPFEDNLGSHLGIFPWPFGVERRSFRTG
jgi:hypothetical protein